jgi:hypothetical protein
MKHWAALALFWTLVACGSTALVATGHLPVFVGAKAPGTGTEQYERDITPPYQEFVDLLTYRGEDWKIDRIRVPSEPGSKAYMCFPLKGQSAVECLYRGIENKDIVFMEIVAPSYEEL